jgi:hypothetical protein
VNDEEWEADFYDLKRSSKSSSVTSPSTYCRSPWKEDGSESTKEILTTTRSEKSKYFSTQVRPGNLVHDKEWEANYYDLRRSSTSSGVTSPSTPCRSPWKEDGSESTKEILTTTRLDAGRQREVLTLDASEKSKHFSTQVSPGNLMHDKEWEADYYNLKCSSTSSSVNYPSTYCLSPWRTPSRGSANPKQVKRVV